MQKITVDQMRALWLRIDAIQSQGYEVVSVEIATELDGLHCQLLTRMVDLKTEPLQRADTRFVLR